MGKYSDTVWPTVANGWLFFAPPYMWINILPWQHKFIEFDAHQIEQGRVSVGTLLPSTGQLKSIGHGQLTEVHYHCVAGVWILRNDNDRCFQLHSQWHTRCASWDVLRCGSCTISHHRPSSGNLVLSRLELIHKRLQHIHKPHCVNGRLTGEPRLDRCLQLSSTFLLSDVTSLKNIVEDHLFTPDKKCENVCQILWLSLLNFATQHCANLRKFSHKFLLSDMCYIVIFLWFLHYTGSSPVL